MFALLRHVLHLLQPLLVPVCFVSAWSLTALTALSIFSFTREAIARSQRLHQIPCADCQFFTRHYTLKCTLHPSDALTEQAIGCRDYEPSQSDSGPCHS